MNIKSKNFGLARESILASEERLCDYLGQFLGFSGHSIFFPPRPQGWDIEYLAAEGRLLIPLFWQEEFLGMLMLAGVSRGGIEPIINYLPAIIEISLENIALSRAMEVDAGTGLASEENFYSHLEQQAAILHDMFGDPGQALQSRPLYRLCPGMAVIDWADAEDTAAAFGLDFCRRSLQQMAAILKTVLPDGARAARLGSHEGYYQFGLIVPAASRSKCHKLAKKVKEAIAGMEIVDALTGARVDPVIRAGYAIYPQDMRGPELRLSRLAQAFMLRDRARLAARYAQAGASDGILSFNEILLRGGRILENLGQGKLRINLGAAANAREGQLFQVLNGSEILGRIVVLETARNSSVAEILFVERAGNMPEPGNSLLLLEGDEASANQHAPEPVSEGFAAGEKPQPGNLKLWSHGEFLAIFAEKSANASVFTLGIASLCQPVRKENDCGDAAAFYGRLEAFFEELKERSSNLVPTIAGRYGANSLIIFHGGLEYAQVRDFYLQVNDIARQLGLEFACGLFSYPFLNYRRSDSEKCALKALEYARLLPEPKIGALDSVALNISADKMYSLGDTFAAMEEYKLALLADPANAMARNSLGVCMADIGKREDAERLFNEALEHASEDAMKARIYYNLGVIFQKRDEAESACSYYRKCVRLDRGHIYAWLRLGQASEKRGALKAARKFYQKASFLAEDKPELKNTADRRLARLEGERGEKEKARELLYEALARDPEDAATMLLLARSYMTANEDLAMAEMFARKSAALNGGDEAWRILAAILVEQGKKDEAREAGARSRN